MGDIGFWSRKRVMLTGHTGFKGGWLSLWLHRMGAEVSGYALPPPTQPSIFEDARIDEVVQSTIGDVRDLPHLRDVMIARRPEIIFHMAAQPLVRYSYSDPVETYAVNVMGTVNLLQAVRECDSVRAVVVVTSDKCYENQEWSWGYRESDRMGGYDPYSSSKGCAELVTAAYRRSFFSIGTAQVGVASARAGNVIGGGDWANDRLVPDVIRALCAREPVVLRAPNAIRPWQHVLEPLNGYLQLAERMWEDPALYGGGWNFGPWEDAAVPVIEVAESFVALWKDGGSIRIDGRQHLHEARYLSLDTSQARRLLNWQARLDLSTAIEWTVEWYGAHRSGDDVRALSVDQIERYMHRHARSQDLATVE